MKKLTKEIFDEFLKIAKKEPMFMPPGRVYLPKKVYDELVKSKAQEGREER